MTGALYWLASYPKSGNTWFRAFMRNLKGRDDDESEDDGPASINDLTTGAIASARAWLDAALGFDTGDLTADEIANLRPTVYRWYAQANDDVLHHKIHDACHRVPNGQWLIDAQATTGALYLIRNPLDVAISYANHNATSIDRAIACMADPEHRLARDKGTHLASQVEQRLSSWSGHVESWIDNPDIDTLVLRYEDMKATPEASFAKAAAFLQLDTDPQKIARAIGNSSFEKLQAQENETAFRERNPKSERFFRKGVAGDWQATLTDPQIEAILTAHGEVMRRFGYCDAAGNPQIM